MTVHVLARPLYGPSATSEGRGSDRAEKIAPRAESGLAGGCSDPRSDGPPLPPMAPGLPNTPILRINQMFAACLVDGLMRGDLDWVNTPDFLLVCEFAGLQGDTPLMIRKMVNERTLNMARLSGWNLGYGQVAVA